MSWKLGECRCGALLEVLGMPDMIARKLLTACSMSVFVSVGGKDGVPVKAGAGGMISLQSINCKVSRQHNDREDSMGFCR